MRRYTELCDVWLNGVQKVFAKFMGVSKMACENKFSINAVYIKCKKYDIFIPKIVDHFEQIMWKGARKIGCARGGFYGEPWYVAHYDQAPDISKDSAIDNIQEPIMVRAFDQLYR